MLALSLVVALPSLELQTSGAAQQIPQITISGIVVDNNGRPISDVVVFVEGSRRAAVLTSVAGTYSVSLPAGGSYTLTPRRAAAVFKPATLSFSNVTTDQTNASFTATFVRTFKVSGTVVDSTGRGVVDVVVRLGDSPQLLTLTSPSGSYSIDVVAGESYTVSPSKGGSTFDPPAFPIANLDRNYSRINFVEVPQDKVRISGTIVDDVGQPLEDVIVGLSGTTSTLTSTGSSGLYGFTVVSGQSYTVAPARNGYSFSPPILTFSALTQNQGSANFVGTRVSTFSVSGVVVDSNGSPMTDATVLLSGPANGAVPTSGLGGYSFSGLVPGSYTVTPVREGFVFSPPTRVLANVLGNQNDVNFVGVPGIPATEVLPGIKPAATPETSPVPSPSPNEATPTPTPTPKTTPTPRPTPTITPTPTPRGFTPTGSNVTVSLPPVEVAFAQVGTAGTTTAKAIAPASAGKVPGGFVLNGALMAFEINTTAAYTPPVDVCFALSSVTDKNVFSSLKILHNEGGTLVDRTTSRDFAGGKICARVTSLSLTKATAQKAAATAQEKRRVTPRHLPARRARRSAKRKPPSKRVVKRGSSKARNKKRP